MLLIRLHTFLRLTTWSSKKSQKFKLQCELENKSWFKSRTGSNCIIYENYNDRSRIAVPNDFHLQNTFEYLYFPWVDLSSCKVMGDLQTHWRVLQNLRILVTCKQHDVQFFLTEINFFIFFFFWQQMCQSYLFSLYINFFPQPTFFHSYKKHGSRNAKTPTVQPRNKANRRRTPANLSTDRKKPCSPSANKSNRPKTPGNFS